MNKIKLNKVVDRQFVQKLLSVGRAFDVDQGGYYDARSGVVNFWCGPDNKPSCWPNDIKIGGLKHPRDYVGGLYWEVEGDEFHLYLEADPFSLLEFRSGDRYNKDCLSKDDSDSVFDWLKEQADGLIRLAGVSVESKGTKCPFCDYVSPPTELLNDLMDHMEGHDGVKVTGIFMGKSIVIETNRGDLTLEESW